MEEVRDLTVRLINRGEAGTNLSSVALRVRGHAAGDRVSVDLRLLEPDELRAEFFSDLVDVEGVLVLQSLIRVDLIDRLERGLIRESEVTVLGSRVVGEERAVVGVDTLLLGHLNLVRGEDFTGLEPSREARPLNKVHGAAPAGRRLDDLPFAQRGIYAGHIPSIPHFFCFVGAGLPLLTRKTPSCEQGSTYSLRGTRCLVPGYITSERTTGPELVSI